MRPDYNLKVEDVLTIVVRGPTARLQLLLKDLDSALQSQNISKEAQSLLEEARQVVDLQDDYLEKISTPAADILPSVIEASDKEDWDAAYERGDTQFRLIRQMCAGSYEASVMQQFARINHVKYPISYARLVKPTRSPFLRIL